MRSVVAAVFLTIATVLAAILASAPAGAQSIGVSPPELVVEDAFRGTEYLEAFGILNERLESVTFRLQVEEFGAGAQTPVSVGDAREWITLEDLTGQEITRIEARPNTTTPVNVRISVPDDAANGTYRANVGLQELTQEELENGDDPGVIVTSGIITQVVVRVTGDQRLEATISDVVVEDTEVAQPLRVRMSLENTGNVELTPEVRLGILDAAGVPVDEVGTTHDEVPVGGSVVLTTEWDTTGRLPAEYAVNVRVLLTGQESYNETFPFELFPEGTFTREGEFLSLELTNRPDPGAVAALIADFHNTGRIDTTAQFIGEVYRDGELVDTVEGTEQLVEAGARAELEAFAAVEDRGEYTIEGSVNFEGRETETRTIDFKVPANLGSGGFLATWQYIAAAVIIVIMVGAAVWEYRRRRRQPVQPGV